jgi:hypothetical protein
LRFHTGSVNSGHDICADIVSALLRLPYLSAGIVMILGLVMSAFGFHAAWLAAYRKSN